MYIYFKSLNILPQRILQNRLNLHEKQNNHSHISNSFVLVQMFLGANNRRIRRRRRSGRRLMHGTVVVLFSLIWVLRRVDTLLSVSRRRLISVQLLTESRRTGLRVRRVCIVVSLVRIRLTREGLLTKIQGSSSHRVRANAGNYKNDNPHGPEPLSTSQNCFFRNLRRKVVQKRLLTPNLVNFVIAALVVEQTAAIDSVAS